jgi:hypothetical protein
VSNVIRITRVSHSKLLPTQDKQAITIMEKNDLSTMDINTFSSVKDLSIQGSKNNVDQCLISHSTTANQAVTQSQSVSSITEQRRVDLTSNSLTMFNSLSCKVNFVKSLMNSMN